MRVHVLVQRIIGRAASNAHDVLVLGPGQSLYVPFERRKQHLGCLQSPRLSSDTGYNRAPARTGAFGFKMAAANRPMAAHDSKTDSRSAVLVTSPHAASDSTSEGDTGVPSTVCRCAWTRVLSCRVTHSRADLTRRLHQKRRSQLQRCKKRRATGTMATYVTTAALLFPDLLVLPTHLRNRFAGQRSCTSAGTVFAAAITTLGNLTWELSGQGACSMIPWATQEET